MGRKRKYSEQARQSVIYLYKLGVPTKEISARTGVTVPSVKNFIHEANVNTPLIKSSNYPIYDKPLEMEGDAVIFPDLEIPFHHAEFVNRVIELSQTWGVEQAIIPGDAVHFDCFSGWEPNWIYEPNGGLTEQAEKELTDMILNLPAKYQDSFLKKIVEIGGIEESPGITPEMKAIRENMKVFAGLYKEIHWSLGNHEGRELRAINGSMAPQEILHWLNLDEDCWKIAPYYYSILHTDQGDWRLSHPKTTAKYAHVKLADKFDVNYAMCHSHYWAMTKSTSGKHWAIQMGHCVDERRLPYAAQRDNPRDAHSLGALIIRNGYPYLLSQETDWHAMKNLV